MTTFRNLAILTSVLIIALCFGSCGSNTTPDENNHVTISNGGNNDVTIQNNNLAGFNVNNLAALVRKSTNPGVLEQQINDPANNVNNLDLDEDGKVDFLKVVESGNDQLEIKDDTSANGSVTVATININPNQDNQTADMNIQANPSYAVDQPYYHSSFSFTDFLLLAYLMRPHPYYMPVYHYGYYPHYYAPRTVVATRRFYSRPGTSDDGSRSRWNRSSLSNPSRSQRSFGSNPSHTGSSSRSSFFGHSGSRSFGGGGFRRSGFGRRR